VHRVLVRRDMSADARQACGQRACGDLLQPVLAVRRTLHRRADPLPGHEEDPPDGGGTATSRHRTRPDSRLPTTLNVFVLSVRPR